MDETAEIKRIESIYSPDEQLIVKQSGVKKESRSEAVVVQHVEDKVQQIFEKSLAEGLVEKNKMVQRLNELKTELTGVMLETGASLINEGSGQPFSEKFISKLVNRFIKTHGEMSNARFEHIIAQNSMTELIEKESQLEDLGGGLKMLDYENLKTEVQTISSNIDLKQEQLDTLQQRFNREQNKFKTAKEKHSQMLEMIEKQKSRHEKLREQQTLMRSNLNQLKTQKTNLRDELNELTQKVGILTRVPLMRNFDDVSDEIQFLSKELFSTEETNKKLSTHTEKLIEEVKALKSRASDVNLLDALLHQDQLKCMKQNRLSSLKKF